MSNNKGNIRLAFNTFVKDLQKCEDYDRFRKDSIRVVYEDRFAFERDFKDSVDNYTRVLKPFKITVYYNTPIIDTKESRRLNAKLFKNLT